MERLREAREEGPEVFEWKSETKDGEQFWAEVSLKTATIAGEESILAVVRDVSERKESEHRYRALVEQSLVGIYIIKDGVFEYVNPKVLEMTGAEPDEIIGASPLDYVHEDDEEEMRENLKKRREGEAESIRYSFTAETFDGKEKIFETHGTSVELTGGPAVAGCIVDVTEEVERKERLRAQKEFTEDALDAIQDIFAVFGSDGTMIDWNRTFAEKVGYTDEEIESMRTVDLVEGEDIETVEASMKEVLKTGSTSLEVEMITKDGDSVPVRWRGSTLQHPEEGEVICGVGRIK
jgi:PAS domain S-box-containing protein